MLIVVHPTKVITWVLRRGVLGPEGRQDALRPGHQVVQHLLADLVGHSVLLVVGGVPLGFQKAFASMARSRDASSSWVPWAMKMAWVRWAGKRPFSVSESGRPQLRAARPAKVSGRGRPRSGRSSRRPGEKPIRTTIPGFTWYCSMTSSKKMSSFPAPAWPPPRRWETWVWSSVALRPQPQLKGDGSVGAGVYVALTVDGGGEAGQVLHVGPEAVQQDDHRVVRVGVVAVGLDGKVDQALPPNCFTSIFSAAPFRSLAHGIGEAPASQPGLTWDRASTSDRTRRARASIGQRGRGRRKFLSLLLTT